MYLHHWPQIDVHNDFRERSRDTNITATTVQCSFIPPWSIIYNYRLKDNPTKVNSDCILGPLSFNSNTMMLNMRVRLTTAAFQLIDFDDPYHADTDMFLVTMKELFYFKDR